MRSLDHTLITRGASVGVTGQKMAACFHLKSATYDWFGLHRMGRNGFDSRFRVETARIVGTKTSRANVCMANS
jgi:hypothetical protein